jgi:hypothetical protein
LAEFSTMRALWALRDDRTLTSADWKMAVTLVSFADATGACHPGLGRLAATARTSRGAARRSLRSLELNGGPLTLTVERNRISNAGDADSHRYVLTVKGWDQADPTPDHLSPTVGSTGPQRVGSPRPQGGITQTPKEDLEEDQLEEDREEDIRARAIFEYWAAVLWSKVHPKRKPKPSTKRMKPIRARVATFTDDELRLVIDAVAASKWMLGENDHGRPFIEPETIFRNSEKVEQWLATKPRQGGVQRGVVDEREAQQWGNRDPSGAA